MPETGRTLLPTSPALLEVAFGTAARPVLALTAADQAAGGTSSGAPASSAGLPGLRHARIEWANAAARRFLGDADGGSADNNALMQRLHALDATLVERCIGALHGMREKKRPSSSTLTGSSLAACLTPCVMAPSGQGAGAPGRPGRRLGLLSSCFRPAAVRVQQDEADAGQQRGSQLVLLLELSMVVVPACPPPHAGATDAAAAQLPAASRTSGEETPSNAAAMNQAKLSMLTLTRLPLCATVVTADGRVVLQNAASREYYGERIRDPGDGGLPGPATLPTGSASCGLLREVFAQEPSKLEAMLVTALGGGVWEGLIRVPFSLHPDGPLASSCTADGAFAEAAEHVMATGSASSGDFVTCDANTVRQHAAVPALPSETSAKEWLSTVAKEVDARDNDGNDGPFDAGTEFHSARRTCNAGLYHTTAVTARAPGVMADSPGARPLSYSCGPVGRPARAGTTAKPESSEAADAQGARGAVADKDVLLDFDGSSPRAVKPLGACAQEQPQATPLGGQTHAVSITSAFPKSPGVDSSGSCGVSTRQHCPLGTSATEIAPLARMGSSVGTLERMMFSSRGFGSAEEPGDNRLQRSAQRSSACISLLAAGSGPNSNADGGPGPSTLAASRAKASLYHKEVSRSHVAAARSTTQEGCPVFYSNQVPAGRQSGGGSADCKGKPGALPPLAVLMTAAASSWEVDARSGAPGGGRTGGLSKDMAALEERRAAREQMRTCTPLATSTWTVLLDTGATAPDDAAAGGGAAPPPEPALPMPAIGSAALAPLDIGAGCAVPQLASCDDTKTDKLQPLEVVQPRLQPRRGLLLRSSANDSDTAAQPLGHAGEPDPKPSARKSASARTLYFGTGRRASAHLGRTLECGRSDAHGADSSVASRTLSESCSQSAMHSRGRAAPQVPVSNPVQSPRVLQFAKSLKTLHGIKRSTSVEHMRASAADGATLSRASCQAPEGALRFPLEQPSPVFANINEAAMPKAAWHEVRVTGIQDHATGERYLLIIQKDVSPKVEAERHIAQVSEAEHRLLESIFPRHVLQYMSEQPFLSAPAAVPPTGAAASEDAPGGGDALPVCDARTSAMTWRPYVQDCTRLATWHKKITILFCDIQGFTPMCGKVSPGAVMAFLNNLFVKFDAQLDAHGVYKVETIGDCYVVAGGLIREDQDGMAAVWDGDAVDERQADKVFAFAKAMLRAAARVALPTATDKPCRVRIGIHTGPAMSGVVGTRQPRFCVFGDTMNTASRMESSGVSGSIHASEATYELLRHEPGWVPTGGIEVKGKGTMSTYLWTPAA